MPDETRPQRKYVKDYTTFEQEYVQLIHQLQKDNPVARVKDIARLRGVASPTVTVAVDRLRKSGLVEHEKSGYVTLTDEGHALALRLERRHNVIFAFLKDLVGVTPETAADEACQIEHILAKETVDKLVGFMEFVRECEIRGEGWVGTYKKRQA